MNQGNRDLALGIIMSSLLFMGSAPVNANPLTWSFDSKGSSSQGVGPDLHCVGNCPVLSTEVSRSGNGSLKTVVDRLNSKTMYRTEMMHDISMDANKGANTTDYWFGFSLYVPSPYPVLKNPTYETFFNVHTRVPIGASKSKHPSLGPPLSLGLSPTSSTGGKICLKIHGTNVAYESQSQSTEAKQFDANIADYTTNKWIDFVIQTRMDSTSAGFTKIWVDGKLVLNYTGINSFRGHGAPYPKFGMYNGWRSRNIPNEPVTKRTLFHDEYSVAWGSAGSYNAVAPK